MNDEYLKYVSKQELPTILSTECILKNNKEINQCSKIRSTEKIAILHCKSYPTDPKDINLNYMKTISTLMAQLVILIIL